MIDRTNAFNWLADPVSNCPADGPTRGGIDTLGKSSDGFLTTIAGKMNYGGNVVVVGYPALFETFDKWNFKAKTMGLCHGIDRAGAERIRGWSSHLNATIGAAVTRANDKRPNGVSFTFVNVNDGMGNNTGHGSFEGIKPRLFEAPGSAQRHNLCGSDSWLAGFGTNLGFFHPNEKGHTAEAELVATTLVNLDWSRLGSRPRPVTESELKSLTMPANVCDHLELPPGPHRLSNGEYVARPGGNEFSIFVGDTAIGDFDGDGIDDGVLAYGCMDGAADHVSEVLALRASDRSLLPVALTKPGQGANYKDLTAELMNDVVDIAIRSQLLRVKMAWLFQTDATCCPTTVAHGTYRFAGSSFVRTAIDVTSDLTRTRALVNALNARDRKRIDTLVESGWTNYFDYAMGRNATFKGECPFRNRASIRATATSSTLMALTPTSSTGSATLKR